MVRYAGEQSADGLPPLSLSHFILILLFLPIPCFSSIIFFYFVCTGKQSLFMSIYIRILVLHVDPSTAFKFAVNMMLARKTSMQTCFIVFNQYRYAHDHVIISRRPLLFFQIYPATSSPVAKYLNSDLNVMVIYVYGSEEWGI